MKADSPQWGDLGDGRTPTAMNRPTRALRSRSNVTYIDDHRAPDVDDMLDRVTAEAERRDEEAGPLPFDPEQLHAARDIDGPSDGELRRRPGKDAGEENQDPGDHWDGA
mgnify:CR=1 FL=1